MNNLTLSPWTIVAVIAAYFVLLVIIARLTSKEDTNASFFNANKSSPWLLVAIGMIGASLSGVTFISIPGLVGKAGANSAFSYMQMVFGYLLGYLVIATVLMPIYYKYSLTSIYGYLEERLGAYSYKVGAGYFLLSRLISASFRLYLVAIVLDKFILGPMGIPFVATVALTIALIWIYTSKGGIKTIVVTDVFQTTTMILAVVLTIFGIASAMDMGVGELYELLQKSEMTEIWHFNSAWSDPNNFFKQFLSGALLAIVMTGLDQDMMQKNLTCKTLKDAQKNVFTFSIILVFANLLFLSLGALLYIYADFLQIEIPEKTDYLYPTLALEYLSPTVAIVFVLGLIAAAYSSADSALTSLTTSFCVDFLGFEKDKISSEGEKKNRRMKVHVVMSLIILILIVVFHYINNDAVVNGLFKAAGYTYGPLLGLFTFGILMKRSVRDKWVPLVCIIAPIFTYILDSNSDVLFGGFKFGFLILALNGLLTFGGLLIISKNQQVKAV